MNRNDSSCCVKKCSLCGVGYQIYLDGLKCSDEIFSKEEGLNYVSALYAEKTISHEEKNYLNDEIIKGDFIDTEQEAAQWLKEWSTDINQTPGKVHLVERIDTCEDTTYEEISLFSILTRIEESKN